MVRGLASARVSFCVGCGFKCFDDTVPNRAYRQTWYGIDLMEEDKIINIDGDSSSSDSESGSGEEEEAVSSAAGKGESSGEESDGQSWDGGDESGGAASPEDPSQKSSEGKAILIESDEDMTAVVASSSKQAMEFLQDSEDEEEKEGTSGLTR